MVRGCHSARSGKELAVCSPTVLRTPYPLHASGGVRLVCMCVEPECSGVGLLFCPEQALCVFVGRIPPLWREPLDPSHCFGAKVKRVVESREQRQGGRRSDWAQRITLQIWRFCRHSSCLPASFQGWVGAGFFKEQI